MNNLLWFAGNNFGDALSPVMFKFLSKKEPILAAREESPKFVMIGSILNHALPGDTVWGSGLAWSNDKVHEGLNITATRGPISAEICRKAGNDCPGVYGDPALLLPLIFQPNRKKKYKLGIVPHVVDYNLIDIDDCYSDEVIKVNLNNPAEVVVDEITSCQYIISSALHGVIAADAYNIPNGWCELSNNVIGDGTKFYDHFAAVKRERKDPFMMSSTFKLQTIIKYIESCDPTKYTADDRQMLLNSYPYK
jgi:pyruvyltransferase